MSAPVRSQAAAIALRSCGPGRSLETVGIFADTPTQPGTALVRLHAAAVTHLDRSVVAGHLPGQMRPPFTPGTEACGTVLASVAHPAGSRVVVRGAGVGVTSDGTWASLGCFPDAALHPCPADLDPATAAAALSPALTADAAVRAVAAVRPGETVAVTGATGVVGRMVAAVVRAAGAARVVGLVRPASVGAADALTDLVDEVVGVGGSGPLDDGGLDAVVDAVIDTVGGAVAAAAVRSIRPGGRMVLLGYTAGTVLPLDLHEVIARDVRLLPVNMQRRPATPEAVQRALADVAAARLPLSIVRMPLPDAQRALDLLARGEVRGRVVLEAAGGVR
jgi:NADPH:quinone reductase-like Zn-dependent oxidoreductase